MASYEFPFNERIRTLLRVEDLFGKFLHNVALDHELSHHCALMTLFQILDVVDRAELKLDLLQELDRQKSAMAHLKGNPAISNESLDAFVAEIDKVTLAMRAEQTKLGQSLRANEWLMSIKQRASIPGGVCEFDVPSYHYWLGLGNARRRCDFDTWIAPLMPMYQAVNIVLQVLRGSGVTSNASADGGDYQQMLAGAKPAQMIRVEVDNDLKCFPEVSANKYAINIRFHHLDGVKRQVKSESNIKFSLTLCNL